MIKDMCLLKSLFPAEIVLLSLPSPVFTPSKANLLTHLLASAKLLIPLHWLQTNPASHLEWINNTPEELCGSLSSSKDLESFAEFI